MKRARSLYSLQEVDLHIGQKLARWQEIQTLLGESEALLTARHQLTTQRAHLEELKKAQKQINLEIQNLTSEIAAVDANLQRTRNYREAENMRQKIQNLRKRLDEKELVWLDLDEQRDAAVVGVNTHETQLAAIEVQWQTTQQELQTEAQALRTTLVRLKEKRIAAQHEVAAEDFKVYEALRRAKRGRAVALVENARCQGCGVGLPSALIQQTKNDDTLTFCGSCGRVLCS